MPRRCQAEHPDPRVTAPTCTLCRKYVTDPAYRAHCDGEAPPTEANGTWELIAPLGTADVTHRWLGRGRQRPHQYRATAIIPHLGTPDFLEACVDLLRLQTVRPYLVVVDTGSPFDVCARLEAMRAPDLEVHFVRGNGYTNSSEPVCVALDLGFARVNTELIFLTHADCFARRRDALEWLASQCSADCPAVGWEMSDRSAATDQWRGMVSHTFTMLHAETMRRLGVTWHMQRARDLLGMGTGYASNGWPDTETGLGLQLRAAGVAPKLLGPEPNYERHVTEWFDHARSLPGLSAYAPGSAKHRRAVEYGAAALAEAVTRAAGWRGGPAADAPKRTASATKPRVEKGKPHCPECVQQKAVRSVLAERPGQLAAQGGHDGVVGAPGGNLPTEGEPGLPVPPLGEGVEHVGIVPGGVDGRLAEVGIDPDDEHAAGNAGVRGGAPAGATGRQCEADQHARGQAEGERGGNRPGGCGTHV